MTALFSRSRLELLLLGTSRRAVGGEGRRRRQEAPAQKVSAPFRQLPLHRERNAAGTYLVH